MRLKSFSLAYGLQIFKSFSDESRVRLLHLITHNQEMCITDLEHILDFTQTKTSRHLIYLKNAGLLSSRKHDQWVFYFLKEEVTHVVTELLGLLQKDPVLQKDLETYNVLYSNRELAINRIESKQWTGQPPL